MLSFAKKHSMQLSFGFVLVTFLTASVGEGQAYEVEAFSLISEIDSSEEGFIGKPHVVGATVLTGEIQRVISYRVEEGDTLTGIASRYNLSVGTLIDANGLALSEIEKIKPGDEIVIPEDDSNTSLAWLDELNQLKAEERQRREQEELRRLAALRRSSASTARRLPQIASTIGGVRIIGSYRGLPTYSAYIGQCTQWVQHKKPNLRRRMGNGGQYLAYSRLYGIPTGKTPRVGAAVVTTEASVGHVAYVEAVNGDTITISEMNYVGWGVVSQRTISVYSPVIRGYVY